MREKTVTTLPGTGPTRGAITSLQTGKPWYYENKPYRVIKVEGVGAGRSLRAKVTYIDW